MQPFELARLRPQTLLGLSVACGVIAALLFLWLLARAIERLIDQPRLPRPGITHGVFLLLGAFFAAIALAAFGTNRLLLDHARLRAPMRLGHLRCEPLADGRVRATFTPEVLSEGHAVYNDSAPPQISEDAGASCRIRADVITMRPLARRIAGPYLARTAAVGQTERNRRASDLWRPETKKFPISLLVREVARVQADAPADPVGRWAVIAMPPETEAGTETMTATPTIAPVLGLQRLAP
jgi:hypothetical protein